jgi:hypothetical protein
MRRRWPTNAGRTMFPQFLTLRRLKLWPLVHFQIFGIHFTVVRRWLLADAHTPSWCVSSSVCYQWNLVPMTLHFIPHSSNYDLLRGQMLCSNNLGFFNDFCHSPAT